jgi:copper chaperone CopZ
MDHTYKIAGMHCQICVKKVTTALEDVSGIQIAAVTLNPPVARVTISEHVDIDELQRAVRSAGDYRLSEDDKDVTSSPEEKKESLCLLLLIVGYIAGATVLVGVATQTCTPDVLMHHFYGGIFPSVLFLQAARSARLCRCVPLV